MFIFSFNDTIQIIELSITGKAGFCVSNVSIQKICIDIIQSLLPLNHTDISDSRKSPDHASGRVGLLRLI